MRINKFVNLNVFFSPVHIFSREDNRTNHVRKRECFLSDAMEGEETGETFCNDGEMWTFARCREFPFCR